MAADSGRDLEFWVVEEASLETRGPASGRSVQFISCAVCLGNCVGFRHCRCGGDSNRQNREPIASARRSRNFWPQSRMSYKTLIKARHLSGDWADSLQARQVLPSLVRRLIHATIENPSLVRFPAEEGIQRRGWDGLVETDQSNAWVPSGSSGWELSTEKAPISKANREYVKRSKHPGVFDPKKDSFIFVTPRKWEGKVEWCKAKRKWAKVIALDCDDLEQWLEQAPAVDAWLTRLMGELPDGVRDLTSYWAAVANSSIPPLKPDVMLVGRKQTAELLERSLLEAPTEIRVQALSLSELHHFVAALFEKGGEDMLPAMAARAIIVETPDAWHRLATSKNRLFLIPGETLKPDRTMVSEAVSSGHHVLTQLDYTSFRGGTGMRLPRIERFELKQALRNSGFNENRAHRIARESGGSSMILLRLASQFTGQSTPHWSISHEAAPLLPLALLGGWTDQNRHDQALVEKFASCSYQQVHELVVRWMGEADSPVRLIDGVCRFVSREDSWRILSPKFSRGLLDEFQKVAMEVLTEDDPRFQMPPGERYLAGFQKKLPRYSECLRKGIAESVGLLGACGEHTPKGSPTGSSGRAAMIVRELLEDGSSQRWFSLSYLLPLLAEASPDEFLTALESDLQRKDPAVKALFDNKAGGFPSSSPHVGLVWALQVLAWNPVHLARVAITLARLSAIDEGGQNNPRPAGALFELFRFWYPQTSVDIDERLAVLELLSQREPDAAWSLIKALVVHGPDFALSGTKPRWRNTNRCVSLRPSAADLERQRDYAGKVLIRLAGSGFERWLKLVGKLHQLPAISQEAVVSWLRSIKPSQVDEGTRIKIWDALRNFVQEHRFFHNAWWSLKGRVLDNPENVANDLAPRDLSMFYRRFFGNGNRHAFGNIDTPHEERENLEKLQQEEAIRKIFQDSGLSGIFEFSEHVEHPFRVGYVLGNAGIFEDQSAILPEKLTADAVPSTEMARGYLASLLTLHGNDWIEDLPLELWHVDAVVQLVVMLPFAPSTWDLLRRRKARCRSRLLEKSEALRGKFRWHRVDRRNSCTASE